MEPYLFNDVYHHWFSNDQHSRNYIDERCGLVFPWFTKPFLDVLSSWNLSDWSVFETGTGYSTLWFAKHCRKLISVETHPGFYSTVNKGIRDLNITNTEYLLVDFTTQSKILEQQYLSIIDRNTELYDCITIDGKLRNEFALLAKKHLKPRGYLVVDNVNQKTIGMDNTPIFEAYKDCEHQSFKHPWHVDWCTDFWRLP